MELVLLAFFVLLVVASVLGWTADSRESAEWRKPGSGRSQPTWPAYPR